MPATNSEGKVTWLLPVRNGIRFLPETLASIESQTYKQWEVLAWDNGSTDGALEELNRWIPNRLPGRVVSGSPLPLSESLREMVLMAETELCARIDADDISMPDRLEKQVRFLRQNREIALVGSRVQTIDQTGADSGSYPLLPCEHDDIVSYALHANPLAHPSVLLRRSAVLAAGNYRYVGSVNIEDYDLWLRMACQCRLANLPDVLLRYRVHEQSVTQQSLRKDELYSSLNARFAEHAPVLYGLTNAEALKLRTRTHPNSLSAIYRVAGHLARTQRGGAAQWMLSPWMLASAAQLTAGSDLVSRAVFKMLRRVTPRPT